MAKKTLIMTIDVGKYKHEWEVTAMCNMIVDYFKKNKILDDDKEDIVLFPTKTEEMKLYWLQGDPDDIEDVEELDEIRDRIKPVLEVALGIKNNPDVKK